MNLGKEHENEEDEEIIENTPEINDSIKSKISKGIIEEDVIIILLAKHFLLKVIKAVLLSIDTYEQDISSVGNKNKKKLSKKNRIILII